MKLRGGDKQPVFGPYKVRTMLGSRIRNCSIHEERIRRRMRTSFAMGGTVEPIVSMMHCWPRMRKSCFPLIRFSPFRHHWIARYRKRCKEHFFCDLHLLHACPCSTVHVYELNKPTTGPRDSSSRRKHTAEEGQPPLVAMYAQMATGTGYA